MSEKATRICRDCPFFERIRDESHGICLFAVEHRFQKIVEDEDECFVLDIYYAHFEKE